MAPLMKAYRQGHLPVVARLIEKGADINTTDDNGNTLISLSCKNGDIDIANQLIDRGCDIHKPNIDRKTPLMNACLGGHLSIVTRFIELCADINITDYKRDTSFSWASKGGNSDIVNLLFEKSFDEHKHLAEACDNEYLPMYKNKDIHELYGAENLDYFLPFAGTSKDFTELLSTGTYESFENRVFLCGSCACGKSTLASVLIGSPIPLTWKSTDGLEIHFGRNGINLETHEMVPLTGAIVKHWVNSILTYCVDESDVDDPMPMVVFAATHRDLFTEDMQKKIKKEFAKKVMITEMFGTHEMKKHIVFDPVYFINGTDKDDHKISKLKDLIVTIAVNQSSW
ncbi:Hypothetical predicted protein [Mytilus galloprovincialis]|uniref:Uncharacterized protein n=1 Tax=Mytilus galloprovincialis TaxID=29158 RepID=A0A8B6HNK4_MYTGA|nr:Hypothetical predicted protein [Mytilus galloprovincialis]